MLEDIAIKFITLPEGGQKAISFGLIFLGAIMAGVVAPSKKELTRAPYFALIGIAFVVIAAGQFIWLGTLDAMSGSYLWGLVLAQVALIFMIGFFLGKIAIARSRDGFGHGRNAFLAFIPLANLVLLLKPSKNVVSPDRTPAIVLLRGGLGVAFAFAMFITAGVLNESFDGQSKRRAELAKNEPTALKAGMEFLIRSQGLVEALRSVSADTKTPITIDKVTTLARVEAQGNQLRRIYIVDIQEPSFSSDFRTKVENNICAFDGFIPLLRFGGSLREIFVKRDGAQIAAYMVTRETCGL